MSWLYELLSWFNKVLIQFSEQFSKVQFCKKITRLTAFGRKKRFSIWDILTFSAQTFSFIRISAKYSRILQNSARIFNGILHHCSIQLFPVVWMHPVQKKRRRKPNVCNFFTFCTQCIGRQHCSLKICEYWSGFTNTNTNREWAAKIQLTFWYWDEMACQWLGCFFQELQLCFKEQLTRMPFYIASGSY